MEKTTVKIVEMEHHFLYLPVYFARARDFFGYIPPSYETKIVQAQAGTDSDTYQRLARGEADIAICDPCAIVYAAHDGFVPQVIAGLVIRGAFWAVNTDSPAASELNDLADFAHIITAGRLYR